MFSKTFLDRMEDPMRSPLDLCDKLNLKASGTQFALLARLGECPKMLDVEGDEHYEAARAVGIFALWRVLAVTGSSGIVLAPTQALGSDFMKFMEAITQRCNPELAEVSGFPRWNLLQFAGRTGWELRVVPPKAPLIRERAHNALVSIILSARNTDPEYVEAMKALEECSTHPKNTLVHVW